MKNKLEAFEKSLKKLITNEDEKHDMEIFYKLYRQFLTTSPTINWNQMRLIDSKYEIDHEKFIKPATDSEIEKILNRLVVIKLNGGLGTTMGCNGPKSLIPLREGITFLDFALLQNHKFNKKFKSKVPLYLMNSFNTDADTRVALAGKPEYLTENVKCFCQSRCPRIFSDTLMPVPDSPNARLEDGWYPPGHGNVFQAMSNSGILETLLKEGRDICFFANIDNTGAQIDLAIAKAMHENLADYLMEVTPKTITDIKGGTLIEINNSLMHLEMPQVPEDKIDEFCSVETFKMFNTNNIWVNLNAVKAKLNNINMEILANKKKLNDGRLCIQLETSIGGAIRNFSKSLSVRVSRDRFLPVKSTQELLALMSNCYYVDHEDFGVKMVPGRQRPIVKLSPQQFGNVPEFFRRIASVPDMSQCLSLTIEGDVKFGENVKLIGNVVIKAESEQSELFISDQTITN